MIRMHMGVHMCVHAYLCYKKHFCGCMRVLWRALLFTIKRLLQLCMHVHTHALARQACAVIINQSSRSADIKEDQHPS
jgi:hypothetical protein